jgi:hypothetical protein
MRLYRHTQTITGLAQVTDERLVSGSMDGSVSFLHLPYDGPAAAADTVVARIVVQDQPRPMPCSTKHTHTSHPACSPLCLRPCVVNEGAGSFCDV